MNYGVRRCKTLRNIKNYPPQVFFIKINVLHHNSQCLTGRLTGDDGVLQVGVSVLLTHPFLARLPLTCLVRTSLVLASLALGFFSSPLAPDRGLAIALTLAFALPALQLAPQPPGKKNFQIAVLSLQYRYSLRIQH